jgi:putative sterol carrier protein
MSLEDSKSGRHRRDRKSLTDTATVFQGMPSFFRKGRVNKRLSFYFSIGNREWTVFVGPESCEVKQGKAIEAADCFLETTDEIFLATLRGDYLPSMMDLMQGKVKTNRPDLLLQFKKIFIDD